MRGLTALKSLLTGDLDKLCRPDWQARCANSQCLLSGCAAAMPSIGANRIFLGRGDPRILGKRRERCSFVPVVAKAARILSWLHALRGAPSTRSPVANCWWPWRSGPRSNGSTKPCRRPMPSAAACGPLPEVGGLRPLLLRAPCDRGHRLGALLPRPAGPGCRAGPRPFHFA